MVEDTHDSVSSRDDGEPEAVTDAERTARRPGSIESPTDPRLQAAEMMRQRLACHPGAAPGTRRIAEDLASALRRVIEKARLIEERITSGTDRRHAPTGSSVSESLDDLDARASDLLGALAALHGVIVRRDLTEAARGLVEAERLLSDVRALEEGTQLAEGDEG
jgi:hypothetical protein